MEGRPGAVLKILIVEDDVQLATTLKYLVEDNPRYRVVATADDLDSAVAAAPEHLPDLALVDLRLAHGSTGFSVAVRMGDFDIPCFFITGKAPDFPMPDLALGCLMKPFTAEDIHRSLAAAEDIMRGREALRPENAGQPHPLRQGRGGRGRAAARLHSLETLAEDPPRALDRRDAALSQVKGPATASAFTRRRQRPGVRMVLSGGRCHPGTAMD